MKVSISALAVAKYFLALPTDDSGELTSNLKLQKLLYYAQGCWVAVHGQSSPLFRDTIYAWKHGPVVKTVYNHYAKFGANALPAETMPSLNVAIEAYLNEVHRIFGKFSAWKLRDMTHREPPWKNNYKPNVNDIVIPLADL
jgi:uncharacterized phage-associated protein